MIDDAEAPHTDVASEESSDANDPAALPREIVEAVGAELATSIQRLGRAEAAVRESRDPEAVHQARVATRRIRTTLKVFRPVLEPRWCDRLRSQLSHLADVLGAARDADVMAARLVTRMSELSPADSKLAEALRDRLQRQQESARAELLAFLEGAEYRRISASLSRAAARPRFRAEGRGSPSGILGPAARAWSELSEAVDALGADPSTEQLHRIRLLTKRARYAAETVAAIAGDGARRFADRAARLQDVLGELQDATVAQAWLREAGVRKAPSVAYAAGLIAGMEAASAERARSTWHRTWERLAKTKVTAWMDQDR